MTKWIVVGVDGSSGSKAALEYAFDEAARRDASVYVITVFHSAGMFGARYGMPISISEEDTAGQIRRQIQELIDELLVDRQTKPEVRLSVRTGWSPAQILTREAEAAELLVVGRRGLGGFSSALLGSVSLQCVLHASCPVVVVRPPRARALAAEKDRVPAREAVPGYATSG